MNTNGYVRPLNINERILQIKNVEGGKKRKKEGNILSGTSIKFSIDIVYLHYMRIGQIGISFQF